MTASAGEVSWIFAFLAGIVSFLSPCVLPLIPGYISLVSKLSFNELTECSTENRIKKILVPSMFFVLGFSLVFVLLGASASYLGVFLRQNKTLLLKISGIIVIVFGLFSMDIIKIPQLYRERRFNLPHRNLGFLGTFLLGFAFGFGWTPCVGPILASILLYASTTETTGKGAALLFVYSAGLGIPFLITGLALSTALGAFSWIKKHYRFYQLVVGGTLVAVGILMVTNNLFYLNIYGQKVLDLAGIEFWKSF